jgi:hypothetical protein
MTVALVVVFAVAAAFLVLVARAALHEYPRPRVSTAVLTRKEQAIVSALADALFPAGGAIPLSGTEAGLVEYMDAYLSRTPPESRTLIRLLLRFVEHGPWIFGPRRARFSSLSPRERDLALTDMAESRVYFRRVAFLSMRTMLSMGYLADDRVAACIGVRSDERPFERRGERAGALAARVVVADAASKRPPSIPPPGVAA